MPVPFRAVLVLALALSSTACPPPELSGAPAEGSRWAEPDIPARGSEAHLDVASWNIEWFGSTGNGPSDEPLQLARAMKVIRGTDADIWGLAEIVDDAAWRELAEGLPGYEGVLASAPAVKGGAASYHRGEQKVGLLYKREVATLVSARVVLARDEATFAGRPPLEVHLRVGPKREDLVVLVVHMKAFADARSWQRRQAAGALLHEHLQREHAGRKVAVIGDWNDDVDVSIARGLPTPYAALVRDPEYTFVTAPLSARRVSSTTGYAELVDHHLASRALATLAVPGSAEVYRVDEHLPDFARTTSDHFPVLSRYRIW